jgi:hypothetical protein
VFGKDVTITDNKKDVLRDPDSHGASMVSQSFRCPESTDGAKTDGVREVCVDSHHQREHRGTCSSRKDGPHYCVLPGSMCVVSTVSPIAIDATAEAPKLFGTLIHQGS